MTKFKFGGRRSITEFYVDYDINTDNRNVYYALSFDREGRCWYALRREAEDDHAPFEDHEIQLEKEELAAMLETMPVSWLPVEAFI